jgi:hypothetical protein
MSRINDKSKLQSELKFLFYLIYESEETWNYLFLSKKLKKQRYFNTIRLSVSKFNWVESVLSSFLETRFQDYCRVNRSSLTHIADLIRNDFGFYSKFNFSQTSIEKQLMYALYKLKHENNSSEFLVSATFWDVSKEHVFNYTWRVIETLSHLKKKFIK